MKDGLFVEGLTGHCTLGRTLRSKRKLNNLIRTRTLVFWVQINCFSTWSHCLSKDQGSRKTEIRHGLPRAASRLASVQRSLRTLFCPDCSLVPYEFCNYCFPNFRCLTLCLELSNFILFLNSAICILALCAPDSI